MGRCDQILFQSLAEPAANGDRHSNDFSHVLSPLTTITCSFDFAGHGMMPGSGENLLVRRALRSERHQPKLTSRCSAIPDSLFAHGHCFSFIVFYFASCRPLGRETFVSTCRCEPTCRCSNRRIAALTPTLLSWPSGACDVFLSRRSSVCGFQFKPPVERADRSLSGVRPGLCCRKRWLRGTSGEPWLPR